VRVTAQRLTWWDIAFLIVSALMALLFIRLGIWQLARLGERRARNTLVIARLAEPPQALAKLPGGGATTYRRVRVAGTYDVAHEVVLTGRTREGSPGVHLVTPLRPNGADTSVLVDRGWVYSPDASQVDQVQWREPLRVDTTGYVAAFVRHTGEPALRGPSRRMRWLDPDTIARAIGYPLAPFYVVLDGDTSTRSFHVPARVPPPPLDEGPHLNYAIQWFAFAAIAVGGAIIAVFGRHSQRSAPALAPRVERDGEA
jgi:surfeit locus 1 family protein